MREYVQTQNQQDLLVDYMGERGISDVPHIQLGWCCEMGKPGKGGSGLEDGNKAVTGMHYEGRYGKATSPGQGAQFPG